MATHLGKTQITWLGHATMLIQTPGGKRLLIDPWVMQNPATPEEHKHIRQLDMMLITHGHFDHIGDAVEIAKQTKPQVFCIAETARWLDSKGVEHVNGFNKGGTIRMDGIAITMTTAVHSCGISDGDQVIYGGEAAGYVVRLEDGYTLYHAGDTALFGDMRLIGELYHPDLAFLPIGDYFTMDPIQAARAAEFVGAKTVIPMHFGTYPIFTGTPAALREALPAQLGITVHDLKPGQTYTPGE